MSIKLLGLLAGFLTSIAIVPQIIKAWRTRRVRDISVWQPLLLEIGMVLWFIYGILIHDLPLIMANGFSIFCNSLLIIMKFRYKEGDKPYLDSFIAKKTVSQEEL